MNKYHCNMDFFIRCSHKIKTKSYIYGA